MQSTTLERLRATPRAGLMEKLSSQRWLLLALIWLLGFALRLFLSQTGRVVWGDEPFYLWLGRNWITGKGFRFMGHPDVHHGPLFPMLSGLLYLFTKDLALASEILYAVFGSLLVLPVYAIGREIYSLRAGLAAAALTAVFPALTVSILHWGTMTEPLYLFFVYLGLWAGLLALRPCWARLGRVKSTSSDPWWAYALGGSAFGLAYLTRPEAIGYLLVVGVFIVLLRALQKSLGDIRFWLMMVLYALGFAAAFVPYAYYVKLNTGSWMVSEKVGVAYLTGIGLAFGDTAAFDRATWGLDSTGLETFFFSSESYSISMTQLILADPQTFVRVLYLNVRRFARVLIDWTLYPYLMLPLLVLGLFDRGWTRERTLKEIYLGLSLLPVLSFVLFYIQARYLVAFVPVMLIWAAHGLLKLGDWLLGTLIAVRTPKVADKAEEGRPYVHLGRFSRLTLESAPLLLTLGLLVAILPLVMRQVRDVGSVRPEQKSVGVALAERVSPDSLLMCRYPAIAYHADTRWVPTPNAPWPEVMAYARHKGVDYVAIDERELSLRPQFTDLVTGEHVPSQLEQVYLDTSSSERLVVYKLVEASTP